MKERFVRSVAAMSLATAFMFFGCSDDSSSVVTVEEPETLSSSDVSDAESSSSAKLDEKTSSSSSKKVSSSSSEEEELSSSSKKERKSSSSSVEDDETNSSSSLENSSSSDIGDVIVPVQEDFYITASELSSRVAGDEVRFKGQFGLNFVGDSTVKDSSVEAFFTSIRFMVGMGSDVNNMAIVPVFINADPVLSPAKNFIDLNSMSSSYVSINLLDPGFTECGSYSLVVSLTANDGEREYIRTEIIPFEREASEYCHDS